MDRRKFLGAVSTASLASAVWPDLVLAQSEADKYPSHVIRWIVPLAAGGGTDLISRLAAAEMGKRLNGAIAVENISGGSGTIGMSTVVRAAPDGYTLLTGSPSLSIDPALRSDLPFDPVTALAPVTMLSRVPYVLVASRESGLHTVGDLLSRAKEKPGLVTFGSPGIGSGGHMAGELFQFMSGVKLTHVPYKGSAPAMIDLRAGRIDLLFGTSPAVSPLIASKILVPVGISSLTRSKVLPSIPTIAEGGVPGFDAGSWYSLFAPAKTPRAIIDKLNAAARYALAQPNVVKAIESDGGEPEPMTPEQMGTFLGAEIAKWRKVVAAAHLKAE
jgi:tripartite-type tricarboxylate transporter receptor subunit TctC